MESPEPVQQIVNRLRASLDDLSRSLESRDTTSLERELAQVRAELADVRAVEQAAHCSAAHQDDPHHATFRARLVEDALRFPPGNPRRRELMEMADGAARLVAELEATRLAHVRIIRENSDLRQELEAARRDLARAYEEMKKLPSPAEYVRERNEATAQQDDLRKQLAHSEGCNAGLRREVEGHLAALSRIAVKLDVPAQGQWLPIEERIAVLCDLVGVTRTAPSMDLLSRVQRLVKRDDESHRFSVGLHKVRAALGMSDDTPVADVVDRMRRVAEGQDAVRVGLRRQIDELSARVAELTAELANSNGAGGLHACENLRLEQENKLLAERLGNAYKLEMDARRELTDARILLDIALKQARQPVGAKE